MSLRLILVAFAALVLAIAGSWPASSVTGPSRTSAALSPNQTASGVPSALSTPAVPQTAQGPAQPAFKIVPAARLGTLGASRSKTPFFRGGVRSHAGAFSSTAPAPRVATASPKLSLYNGLNKPGETAATNVGVTPPDSTGAIGPNNYVEMVNSTIAVYDRSLVLVSSATLDNFVGVPGTLYCDPQIQWDPSANRWLFAFLYCGNDPNNQGFFVGWSRAADPATLSTAGWCEFLVTTQTLLFDYPKLGHNRNFLIVGGNFYANPTTSNPSFVSAAIAWVPLPSNGDSSCTPPTISGTSIATPLKDGDGSTNAFTPVPVNTMTSAADGYVLSAYDPSGSNNQKPGPRSKLAVWHLDSAGVLNQDADITVTSYTFPSSAPQSGTPDVIDTLDARLTQAVGDPATGIWTQHTVAGPGGRSVVDWYEITVSGSASLTQQGTVSSATDFIFNAAISPESDAQGAAIVYNRSSSSILPVIAAKVRRAGTAAGMMEPGELVLASSLAADTDFSCNNPNPGAPCRWGDYSAATPDPVQTNVVWGTNEFNTATGSAPAWADENYAILVAVAPHAPTAVTATAGNGAATISWTPSPFDPGAPVTSYTVTAYIGATPGLQLTVAAPATGANFAGLTNGVTYTFTVIAINIVGASPESPHSNQVTPLRQATQAPASSPRPTRSPVTQTTPNPPPQPRP